MKSSLRLLLLATLLLKPACRGGHDKPVERVSPWMWVAGAKTGNPSGAYGTLNVASPSNQPGGRQESLSWTDSAGHFRLFGGYAFDQAGTLGYLNDLWSFDGGQWTWRGGSDTANGPGNYGTLGVSSPLNIPGGRAIACSAVDSAGNLWVFGGYGNGNGATQGYLNDLWKFDGTNWTWISGAATPLHAGVYGTRGTPAPANAPGSREMAVCWMDSSGNFWLFGGLGHDSATQFGNLNDLWRFDGTNWTWVSGSNVREQPGVYGTVGVPAAANVPGAREGAVAWRDGIGDLWLFGGMIYDPLDPAKCLNDLWRFDGANWTWMSGASVVRQLGSYGTQGVPAVSNVPGARVGSVSWKDSTGIFWIFGGWGYDSTAGAEQMNDLWSFDGTVWTWVSGSATSGSPGVYGMPGARGPDNEPGGRQRSLEWTASDGRFWFFGGYGRDTNGGFGDMNDVWVYFR